MPPLWLLWNIYLQRLAQYWFSCPGNVNH